MLAATHQHRRRPDHCGGKAFLVAVFHVFFLFHLISSETDLWFHDFHALFFAADDVFDHLVHEPEQLVHIKETVPEGLPSRLITPRPCWRWVRAWCFNSYFSAGGGAKLDLVLRFGWLGVAATGWLFPKDILKS